jgi:hypothetical protein
MKSKSKLVLLLLALIPAGLPAATVVNIDIARDETGPLGGSARVLTTSVGPAPDTGTIWNDYAVSLDAAGSTVPVGYSRTGLLDSTGGATTMGLTLNGGWYRTVNGTTGNALQLERAFTTNGVTGIATLTGLVAGGLYDLYLFSSGNLVTTYQIGATSKTATGSGFLQAINAPGYGEGIQYVTFLSMVADESGNLQINALPSSGTTAAALAGLQVVAVPEPSAAMILVGSLAGLGLVLRRR